MPRPPHPRRAEALAYLVAHPGDVEGAAAQIGVTPDAVRRWVRGTGQARPVGVRGPDRRPRAQHSDGRTALIAGALLSEPEASTEAIGAALGVTGQRVRQVRAAYLTDGE